MKIAPAKNRFIVACACIALSMVAGILAWAVSSAGGEPRYGGKTLSKWLAQYSDNRESEANSAEAKSAAEAAEALRHIGTNALPFVIEWMREGPACFDVDGYFEVLGPEAAPAITPLKQMLNRPEQQVVRRAIYPLAYIGKESLPTLVAALGSPENPDRSTIADAIRLMAIQGVDTTPSVPVLVQCLKETNTWLAMSAADALMWAARRDPNAAIPALVGCLKDPRTQVRDSAAEALGSFRRKAGAAVPSLQKLLTDTDPHVRWQATNSILKIAPEEAPQAAAQPEETQKQKSQN